MKGKIKKILTTLFVIACIFAIYLSLDSIFSNSSVQAAWYDTGGTWTNRKPIIVDHNKVAGTLYDFPMLVSVIDPDLRHTSHGGKVGKVDGTDILFTDADGTTKLDHEIEKYASTTGELVAWVKVVTLSHTADTGLYMYFGNSGASDQQNATGVWDGDYRGVWHLDEGDSTASNFYKDSTSNGKNMTLTDADGDSTTDTKIGGAFAFSGDADNIKSSSATMGLTQLTSSAWVKYNSDGVCSSNYEGIVSKNNFGDFISVVRCTAGATEGQIVAVGNNTIGGLTQIETTGYSIKDAGWSYVTFTHDGTNIRIYLNDTQRAIGTLSGDSKDSSAALAFGSYSGNTQYLNGSLDEVRVSSVARSPEWIATEYNNQSSPSTFYSYGSLQLENKTNSNVRVRGGSGSTPGVVKIRGGSSIELTEGSISLVNKENNVSTTFPKTSGSLTWDSGARGIVAVAIACPGGGSPASGEIDVTGGSVTWNELGYTDYGGRRGIAIFLSDGTPSSGTLSIDYPAPSNCAGAGSPLEIQYSIDQITGFNTSDIDDPVQVAGFTSGTSLNLADLGTIDSGDLVYAAFGIENASDNLQPATGLTQHVKRETGGNVRSFLVGYSSTDDTPGITWNSSGGNGGVGFIINVGSGGSGGSPGSVKFR